MKNTVTILRNLLPLLAELGIRPEEIGFDTLEARLHAETSALTAIGNDLGFEELFARQIEALGKEGDVAIAITTSGKSANVTRALRQAKAMGIVPAALTGKGGGELVGLASPILIVPSDTTARIQEMHITLGQMLCGAVEIELGLAR